MSQNQLLLLKSRRFAPLFTTQFLGAFNDNLFKNALVVLITYVLAARAGLNAQIVVTLAAGVFILPFFMFSASAGQLAEKYNKALLIQRIKLDEIGIMTLAGVGLYFQDVAMLMIVLFLAGVQSAYFGPVKYGILPDQLAPSELLGGNALIETGTFLAILTGTMVGGLLILNTHGPALVTSLGIVFAVAGWLASRAIPATSPVAPDLIVSHHVWRETVAIIRHAAGNRRVFLSILGISWFWFFAATYLAQFPTLAKDVVRGDETVVTLFLVVFSIGIGIGSLLCNRLLKGQVNATFVPVGLLGMTLFSIDLYFATAQSPLPPSTDLLNAVGLLSSVQGWRIALDLTCIATAGGLYIVPLYAILQSASEATHRSRNIAGNNVMNALFMVVSALATAAMLALGVTVPEVLLTLAIMNIAVGIYVAGLLPGDMLRGILVSLLELFFRVEVRGLEHVRAAGDRVLVVANHVSFLDAVLLAAFLPDKLTFAVNSHIARKRLIRPFLSLADTFALDPTNPLAVRELINRLRAGGKIVLFPEGRITVTGALMKVYEGPGMIAEKSGAQILPVRIDGAQYTYFSRLRGKVRLRLFPHIRLTVLKPLRFDVPEHLTGRQRRQVAGEKLYSLMTNIVFETSAYRQTLFESLIDAMTVHGPSQPVLEDIARTPLSYRQLIASSFVLGASFGRHTRTAENVGILLANSIASIVSFFALQVTGRVPAMLNYSTGSSNLLAACRTARITTLISSRRFVTLGALDALVADLVGAGLNILYLEDLQERTSWPDRLLGMLGSLLPGLAYRINVPNRDPNQTAAVLFTSGTEGSPKGVVLSHTNLQANRAQISACIDFGPGDTVFNALPMFHSFGLTCGTLLPVLSGLRTFLYPSPLHYRIVPELVYDSNATILFGTDTFLAGYARHAHAYDFYAMRYVFAGAEKLKDETRRLWAERFGVRVLEGYGSTETSPVICLNTPMANRSGSVGKILPGMTSRLVPVPGIATGGRLLVAGPNVLLGYLLAQAPGVLQPLADKWYDTGDIVALDEQGFVYIQGRAKRFAKIGGEMVSLAAVESDVSELWPNSNHAVTAIADAKKGEQLILVTTQAAASRKALLGHWRSNGLAELSLPKTVQIVAKLPLLGTGKIDHVAVATLISGTN